MSTPLDKLFENIEYDEYQNEERYAGIGEMKIFPKPSENLKRAESQINGAVLHGFFVPKGDGEFVLVEINNNEG